MIVELSEKDVKVIDYWYQAAAGESVSMLDDPELGPSARGLLQKLGIDLHPMDVKD